MDFLKTGLGVASAVALTLVLANHPEMLAGSAAFTSFNAGGSTQNAAAGNSGTSSAGEVANTYYPPFGANATQSSPPEHSALAVPAASVAPAALTDTQRARMSPPIAELAESGSGQLVDVIVAYRSWRDLMDAERVVALDGELKQSFTRSGLQVIRLPAVRLPQISLESNVKMVALLHTA